MSDIYVHQQYNYGLGNFINLTPTIKLMADNFDKPVSVYFDLPFIRDCFLDCPFIDILKEKPDYQPLFSTSLIDKWNQRPDYLYVYKEITKQMPLSGEIPHTYVDRCEEIEAPKYNTVFIRGSGSENKVYLSLKMPDDKYYKEYFAENLAGNYTEAFTGSSQDVSRSGDLFGSMVHYIAGIRFALALIREADYVVANDTGLAHAAGAMNKPMTILWKNTSLPKNCNPGKRTNYRMCH